MENAGNARTSATQSQRDRPAHGWPIEIGHQRRNVFFFFFSSSRLDQSIWYSIHHAAGCIWGLLLTIIATAPNWSFTLKRIVRILGWVIGWPLIDWYCVQLILYTFGIRCQVSIEQNCECMLLKLLVNGACKLQVIVWKYKKKTYQNTSINNGFLRQYMSACSMCRILQVLWVKFSLFDVSLLLLDGMKSMKVPNAPDAVAFHKYELIQRTIRTIRNAMGMPVSAQKCECYVHRNDRNKPNVLSLCWLAKQSTRRCNLGFETKTHRQTRTLQATHSS